MASYECNTPRIIISDIGLAGGPDGCALLRQIRAFDLRRGCQRTPAIAVSGGEDIEAAARAAGFDDFLAKPLDVRRLLARIRRLAPAD
jgi:DNA-binding response OmpR family regulator